MRAIVQSRVAGSRPAVIELEWRRDGPTASPREPPVRPRDEHAAREIVDAQAVESGPQAIGGHVVIRRSGSFVVGDGRERRSGRVGALARDRGEVEPQDSVGVLHESQTHAGWDVRVGDARLDEGERTGHVEVVGETLAEELVPALERDLAERGGDARAVGGRGACDLREDAHALAEMVEPLRGLPQCGDAELHARAVVREQALKAERERIDAERDDLVDLERVLRGLGHLHAIGKEMLAMHPGADDGVAECPFGLRDLVLVVRKDVVDAAGMDVETLTEVFGGHRRTLDVPTGIATSPRRAPDERASLRLGVLPEREVRRVPFVRIGLRPHALPQRLARRCRKGDRSRRSASPRSRRSHRRRTRDPCAISCSMRAIISGTCAVARGYAVAGRMPRLRSSSRKAAS